MGRMEELFYELYASSKRHDSWQRQAMIRELRNLLNQPKESGSDHFERLGGNDRRFGGGQFREGADDDDERDLLWKKENPEDPSLNDKQLVESEVATEPIETKHGIVKPEANANVILANLEEEPIPQIQVPISKLERGLKIHNVSPAVCEDSQYVVGCDELCEHQGSILQVSHVKEGNVLVTDSASVTINQVAHQLFDKMSFRVQSKRRQIKHLKGWKFKFKRKSWVGIMLQIAQYKLWERRRRMYTKVSTNIKDESMKVMITWNHQRMLRQLHKSRVQCKMRLMNDSWSMRQPTLKTVKSPKTWMFKYKSEIPRHYEFDIEAFFGVEFYELEYRKLHINHCFAVQEFYGIHGSIGPWHLAFDPGGIIFCTACDDLVVTHTQWVGHDKLEGCSNVQTLATEVDVEEKQAYVSVLQAVIEIHQDSHFVLLEEDAVRVVEELLVEDSGVENVFAHLVPLQENAGQGLDEILFGEDKVKRRRWKKFLKTWRFKFKSWSWGNKEYTTCLGFVRGRTGQGRSNQNKLIKDWKFKFKRKSARQYVFIRTLRSRFFKGEGFVTDNMGCICIGLTVGLSVVHGPR